MKTSGIVRIAYNRLKKVSSNPYFLSLVAVFVVILLLPYNFPKYSLTLVDKEKMDTVNIRVSYDDMDGNGFSDKIVAFNNPVKTCGLALTLMPSLLIQEWDFPGQFVFNNTDFVVTGDYDGDGKKEIFAFSISHDSLYLNIIPHPYILNNLDFISVFITKLNTLNGKSHVKIATTPLCDLNGDGFKELVFSVVSGYTMFPRRFYAYDVKRDSLRMSPPTGIEFMDFTTIYPFHDKNPYFLVGSYASTNVNDSICRLHDQSAWLVLLDNKLNFVFPPIEFPGKHGSTTPFLVRSSPVDEIGVLHSEPGEKGQNTWLWKFSLNGKMLKKTGIGKRASINFKQFYFLNGDNGFELLLQLVNKEILRYGANLDFKGKLKGNFPDGSIYNEDVDGDGQEEIISVEDTRNQLYVMRSDFSYPRMIDLDLMTRSRNTMSMLYQPGKSPEIIFMSGPWVYYLEYGYNRLYYWHWALYLLIYLMILGFTLTVQWIQKNQMQKRFDREKKITELQLKIVRNQMDPHFTMNAINSIIVAIELDRKEEARNSLMHFSKLYRSLLSSAETFKRPLAEEIEFTRSYLALEKFRFSDRFDYSINIDPESDLGLEVPKMVIQSHVENAVKHGLRDIQSSGMITIRVRHDSQAIVLEITDNGIGRDAARNSGYETSGKGMKIMDQFYDLYEKITGTRIYSEITDLYTPAGMPSGTSVKIIIPVSKPPRGSK